MKKVIPITKSELNDFSYFVKENEIIIDAEKVYCNAVYLKGISMFISWDSSIMTNNDCKKIIRMINMLIKNNRYLVLTN